MLTKQDIVNKREAYEKEQLDKCIKYFDKKCEEYTGEYAFDVIMSIEVPSVITAFVKVLREQGFEPEVEDGRDGDKSTVRICVR